jgi:transposase
MDDTGSGLPNPARHGQNERATTLNRKNALFAGSDGGAEHWATIASLIETCKLNDTDVLTRVVNGHPNSDIDQLLPWAYPKPNLQAVA